MALLKQPRFCTQCSRQLPAMSTCKSGLCGACFSRRYQQQHRSAARRRQADLRARRKNEKLALEQEVVRLTGAIGGRPRKDEERARVAALKKQGLSYGQIAIKTGRSAGSMPKVAETGKRAAPVTQHRVVDLSVGRHKTSEVLVDRFLQYLRAERGLAETTIAGYILCLERFVRSLQPGKTVVETDRDRRSRLRVRPGCKIKRGYQGASPLGAAAVL